jgi:hypothetical protein
MSPTTVDAWLEAARRDALARGLPEIVPILESLAAATRVLRAADFNADASGAHAPKGSSQ